MARRKKPGNAPAKTSSRFKLKVQSIPFVQAVDVVPKQWHDWFWNVIADGAPFTWGDNDYSIISMSSFINWCERCIEPYEIDENSPVSTEDLNAFYTRLRSLGNLWLDMECKAFPALK